MEKMKVLFVATVVKTHIMEFHIPYLKMFQDMGWETAVASKNDYEDPADCIIPHCDHYYDIPFARIPWKKDNIRAYQNLKKIIDEGGFDLIHCHTPVGAMIARLAAASARKRGTKVIYTAHGFHFYIYLPSLYPICFTFCPKIVLLKGFSGSSAAKESTCSTGDPGSIPGSRQSPGEWIDYPVQYLWASLVAQTVKNLPAMWEV